MFINKFLVVQLISVIIAGLVFMFSRLIFTSWGTATKAEMTGLKVVFWITIVVINLLVLFNYKGYFR